MNAQTMLNSKYEKLCQVLGDLEFKRTTIEDQIKNIKQEISTLNALVPEILKIEKTAAAELERINKRGISE